MPQTVEIPGVATLEFPDGMSSGEILKHTQDFYGTTYEGQLKDLGLTKEQAAKAQESVDRRADLFAAQREGARTESVAGKVEQGAEWADWVVRPFAGTQENPLGGLGTIAGQAGQALSAAGDVTAAAVRDVRLGQWPEFPQTMAALSGSDIGPSPGGAIGAGLDEAGRMAPVVAGSMALTAAGVPPAPAMGAPMFATTWAQTQDLPAAATSGAIGALLPGVGGAARDVMVKVLGNAVEKGILSGGAGVTQKIAEEFANQGGIQLFMEGMNLPEYWAMSPEERKHALVRNAIANTAFSLTSLPGIVRGDPSHTQTELGPRKLVEAKAGEVLEKLVNDPAAMETLLRHANQVALDAKRVDAPHAVPGRIDWLIRPPAELQEVPPELLPVQGREVPVESPATITGSNEGTASEMPAEAGATPAPEKPILQRIPPLQKVVADLESGMTVDEIIAKHNLPKDPTAATPAPEKPSIRPSTLEGADGRTDVLPWTVPDNSKAPGFEGEIMSPGFTQSQLEAGAKAFPPGTRFKRVESPKGLEWVVPEMKPGMTPSDAVMALAVRNGERDRAGQELKLNIVQHEGKWYDLDMTKVGKPVLRELEVLPAEGKTKEPAEAKPEFVTQEITFTKADEDYLAEQHRQHPQKPMEPLAEAMFRVKRAKAAFVRLGKWSDQSTTDQRTAWQRARKELDVSAAELVKERRKAATPKPKPDSAKPAYDDSMLRVPVEDVAADREAIARVEIAKEELRKPMLARVKAIQELEGRVYHQRGRQGRLKQIKKSASSKDVAQLHSLQKADTIAGQAMAALDETVKQARARVEAAKDAEIINDAKQPRLRRLDRLVRFLEDRKQPVPPEVIAARDAEAEAQVRLKFSDATAEEIKWAVPEVARAAYLGDDALGERGAANLANRRRGQLEKVINDAAAVRDELPEDLQKELGQYGAFPGNFERKLPLTAEKLAELTRRVEAEKERLGKEREAEAARVAELERVEAEKEAKLLEEAQGVVNSAKRVGTVGGRKASAVKEELVQRIEERLDELIEASHVRMKPDPQEPDGWVAEGDQYGAHGTITKTDKGSFKVWAQRFGHDAHTLTVDTLAEGQRIIKALAATGRGTKVIAVPGDGVYRLRADGDTMVGLRIKAGRLQTGSGSGGGGGGVRGEAPPGQIRTADDWVTARDYHGLTKDDKISQWSARLAELAAKVNPQAPDSVTTADVEKFIAEKTKAKEKPKAEAKEPPEGAKGSNAYPDAPPEGGEPPEGARERVPGELGGPVRPPPAEDPTFSVFDSLPVELPEAVRFARDLLEGQYPRIREVIAALGGRAAGVFISTDGPNGRGRIELKADAVKRHFAEALSKQRLLEMAREAREWAKANAEEGDDVPKMARERYEFLKRQALDKAKAQNPTWALKLIWHEIGHLVDWMSDKAIRSRGNIFGRIASLKRYTDHVLPIDPARPHGKNLTEAEKTKLRVETLKQLRDELGPISEIVEKVLVEEPILRMVGITAEDVKNLLGMDAREKTPELYRWFAEQSAETKKEILKKALKGMLDERLAAMGRQEQVGTKKTWKTIRKKEGREPTQAEIQAKFKKLFREELERRNLSHLDAIKAELTPLIAWWRGTAEMEDYFKPAVEMYAEAFSIFMNNPAAVSERAPQYYRLMHYHMGAKPEVQALYDHIQAQIRSGNIMNERVTELRSMWNRDDVRSLKRWRESFKTASKDLLDNVIYHIDRRFGPIYKAASRSSDPGAVRDAVGNFLYRAAEHELILNRMNRDVGRPLVKANLDWNDLGEYMFHQRIINDRYKLWNPQGWTSKNSIERLKEMEEQLGPQRYQTLVDAQKAFRQVYEEEVLPLLHEAKMFSEQTQELIDTAVWYATFAAIKDEPSLAIDRLIQSQFGSTVGPHIYRQVGNVGEIKQPATATVLKALSLVSAAHRNIAKREVVRMLNETEPTEIRPADTRWNGKANEPVIVDTPDVGTIVVMQDGKARAFYVRKAYADAVNYGNPIENRLLAGLAKASGWLKGAFTQLNYGFWPVNFAIDTGSFMLNMPGLWAPVGWAKAVPRAIKAARASVGGRVANPHADAALRRRMLISRSDPAGVWNAVDNEFDLKVASYGLDPAQWDKQAGKVRGLVKLWQKYREAGQVFERVNKIAGMIYLDEKFPEMPEWKKREIVRERAGSPNFLERGASNPMIDLLMMFYNPWKEGIRSTVKAAKENPFSYGAKYAGSVLIPTLVQAAASQGLLGDDLKKKYRSIPDYDMSNYYCIPLGWQDEEQGKVAYLRLPLPEPMRIGHGLFYKAMSGRGRGALGFVGGQVPGTNPMFGVLAAWAEWGLFDHNYYDSFRGQPILDETTFQAGGTAAAGALAKWSWNEMGGSLVNRFQNTQLESPPEGAVEDFLHLPIINNALGRWIKVSNRGIDDADRELTKPIQQHHAELRLGVRELMRKMLANEAFTDSEKVMMREPYAQEYLLRTLPEVVQNRELPIMRRLGNAKSQEERIAILGSELDPAEKP